MKLALLCLIAAPLFAQSLETLYDDYYRYTLREFPEFATSAGVPGFNDKWAHNNAEAATRRRAALNAFLERARATPLNSLAPAARLNHRLFLRELQDSLKSIDTAPYYAINHFASRPAGVFATLSIAPAATVKDYEDQITRIQGLPEVVRDVIASANDGLRRNLKAPRLTAELLASQIILQMQPEPARSPLLAAFGKMPTSIPPAERTRLQSKAEAAYRDSFQPAWKTLHNYITTTYIPATRTTIGMSQNFNGAELYEAAIVRHVTIKMSAREIHDTGVRELSRIQEEMAAIRRELKFDGTAAEFSERILNRPDMVFKSEAEILAHGRDIAKRVDPQLPRLFKLLPRMPYGVEAIPAHRARTAAPYYQLPARDGSRAGNFFLRTVDPHTQSKCCMAALILHEAVPGHHLQIALAQEMENMPEFRKGSRYTAFSEGWGLYAETLGADLGIYDNPYERYGKLQSEILRAIRLMVDTGIHSMNWTREQAIEALQPAKGGWLNDGFLSSEVDRYIANPGQALAYKIGGLKIEELRRKAEKALGSKFDIREFHQAVLENGALPLDILEEQIDTFIATTASSPRTSQ